ncbi:MAG: hypothetical protein ACTSXQ_02850 [Alphaproteobacteria bacterium]
MNHKFLTALAALFLITACRSSAMVYNVDSATFYEPAEQVKEVESAIIRAGYDLGWSMKKVSLGKMTATLPLRSHLAIVNIYYTRKSFSIAYKSSQNLKYNAEKNTIHPNYNSWIRNLEKKIMRNYAFELTGQTSISLSPRTGLSTKEYRKR